MNRFEKKGIQINMIGQVLRPVFFYAWLDSQKKSPILPKNRPLKLTSQATKLTIYKVKYSTKFRTKDLIVN